MKEPDALPPLPRLPESALGLMDLLYEARPVPLPVGPLAKGGMSRLKGTSVSAERRTWRVLNELRKKKLVASAPSPTTRGRPALHWYLLPDGVELLLALGRITREQVKGKARAHKALRAFMLRTHELHVHEVKAELLLLAVKNPAVQVRRITTDRTAYTTVQDRAGVEWSVAPDLVAELTVNGIPLVLFAEIQGTATQLQRGVADKLTGYKLYFSSGNAEARYHCRNFRLAFISFSPEDDGGVDHALNMLEVLTDEGGVDRLALVATITDATTQGLAAPIFWRPHEYRLLAQQHGLRDVRHAVNRVRAHRTALVTAHLRRMPLLG